MLFGFCVCHLVLCVCINDRGADKPTHLPQIGSQDGSRLGVYSRNSVSSHFMCLTITS